MKKYLVTLVALASTMAASAQSSVTVFGVLDAAISGYDNTTKNQFGSSYKSSSTQLSTSGYNFSRLGFRGTEDLGGGLAASFWLEAGLNVDTGNGFATGGGMNFNRRSTVSLSSGNFGEFRLGRDYTPTFWNDTIFDPFNGNGVGINLINTASSFSSAGAALSGFAPNTIYIRTSNSVGYFLPPNLGGFYGQVMYAFNEATSFDPGALTTPAVNSRVGRYVGGRVGYAKGPLDVALGVGSSTTASQYFVGSTTTLDIWNLGATYDFGVLKLFGEYSNNKQRTSFSGVPPLATAFGFTTPGADGALIGVTVPIGPGLIRASYSEVKYRNVSSANQIFPGLVPNPKADKFALGYVYNLSKRTALYATVAYLENKNGADLTVGGPDYVRATNPALARIGSVLTPSTSVGYDFGIRHAF